MQIIDDNIRCSIDDKIPDDDKNYKMHIIDDLYKEQSW